MPADPLTNETELHKWQTMGMMSSPERWGEGYLGEKSPPLAEPAPRDPLRVHWRALPFLYDQVIGHCECLPQRDLPDSFFSIHFSCIHNVMKPGWYSSEHAFMTAYSTYALSCTRVYGARWYDAFLRGMRGHRLEPLYEGPPMPGWDAAHDDIVQKNRQNRPPE